MPDPFSLTLRAAMHRCFANDRQQMMLTDRIYIDISFQQHLIVPVTVAEHRHPGLLRGIESASQFPDIHPVYTGGCIFQAIVACTETNNMQDLLYMRLTSLSFSSSVISKASFRRCVSQIVEDDPALPACCDGAWITVPFFSILFYIVYVTAD